MGEIGKKIVAALAALSLVATMGLASVSAAEMVPHKANAAGNFAFPLNGYQLRLDGTGTATRLGKIRSSGDITFLGGPDSTTGCIPLHDDQTLTSIDTGEQITIEVMGEACPTTGASQPFATGVYQIVADFSITGGTGRFAGASGAGQAVCYGGFGLGGGRPGIFSFTQVGSISR